MTRCQVRAWLVAVAAASIVEASDWVDDATGYKNWPNQEAPVRRDVPLSIETLAHHGLKLDPRFGDAGDREPVLEFRAPVSWYDRPPYHGWLLIVACSTVRKAHHKLANYVVGNSGPQYPRMTKQDFPAADVAFGIIMPIVDVSSGHRVIHGYPYDMAYTRANVYVNLRMPVASALELSGKIDELLQKAPIWMPGDPTPHLVVSPGFREYFAAGDSIVVADRDSSAGLPEIPPPTGSGGSEVTVGLPGGENMEFVWIGPGTFTMGVLGYDPFEPYHQVAISEGFYMGKYEVTQAQWESVMGTTPWLEPDRSSKYVRENPRHPVGGISWNHWKAFIRQLNEAAEDTLYRLPTEAEWEYACRAGTTTRWSFGDDESQLGEHAWYRGNTCDVGECYLHEVGTKLPNPWGLYDMHGNAWEWVLDWYEWGYYLRSPSVDPMGPPPSSKRVQRGGNFLNSAVHTRSADRFSAGPDEPHGAAVRLVRRGPEITTTVVKTTSWGQVKRGARSWETTR